MLKKSLLLATLLVSNACGSGLPDDQNGQIDYRKFQQIIEKSDPRTHQFNAKQKEHAAKVLQAMAKQLKENLLIPDYRLLDCDSSILLVEAGVRLIELGQEEFTKSLFESVLSMPYVEYFEENDKSLVFALLHNIGDNTASDQMKTWWENKTRPGNRLGFVSVSDSLCGVMREQFANLLLAAQIASDPEQANTISISYIQSVSALRERLADPFGVGGEY